MYHSKYVIVEKDRLARLMELHDQFTDRLTDENTEPVKVYDLSQRVLDELELIREVSATLQDRKNEYIRKITQAAKEAKEKAENDKEAAIKEAQEEADMQAAEEAKEKKENAKEAEEKC